MGRRRRHVDGGGGDLLFETMSLPVVSPPVFIALVGLGIVKRLIGLGCGSGRGCALLCSSAHRADDAWAAPRAAPCESWCASVALEWTVELVLLALATLPLSISLSGSEAARANGAAAATAEAVFLSSLRMARTALVFVLPLLFFFASDELDEAGRGAARGSSDAPEMCDGSSERRSADESAAATAAGINAAADSVYTTPQKLTRERRASVRRSARGGSDADKKEEEDDDFEIPPPSPGDALLVGAPRPARPSRALRDELPVVTPPRPPPRGARRRAARRGSKDTAGVGAAAAAAPTGARARGAAPGVHARARIRLQRAALRAVYYAAAACVATVCSAAVAFLVSDVTQSNPLGGPAGAMRVVLQPREWLSVLRPSKWRAALSGVYVTKSAADAAAVVTPLYDVLLGATLSAILPLAMASLAVYCGTGLVALPLVVLPPAPQRCARRGARSGARASTATARASPRGAPAAPRMRSLESNVVVARAVITQLERETSDLLSSTSWRGVRPSGEQRERRDALRAKLACAHDALKALEAEARAVVNEEEEWRALTRTGDVCAAACVGRCCIALRPRAGALRLARDATAFGAYGAGGGAAPEGGVDGDDVDVSDGDGDTLGYAYDDDMPLPTILAVADARDGACGLTLISPTAWLARALCGGGAAAVALLLVLAVAGAGLERVLQPANFAHGGMLAQSLPRSRASRGADAPRRHTARDGASPSARSTLLLLLARSPALPLAPPIHRGISGGLATVYASSFVPTAPRLRRVVDTHLRGECGAESNTALSRLC